jgi:hypothetical protein
LTYRTHCINMYSRSDEYDISERNEGAASRGLSAC